MLRLTEITREVTGVPPDCRVVLLNPHVIVKVEPHEEHGIDGPCVKITSDEQPTMICLGTVAELDEQFVAMEAKEAAAEVLAVTGPLIEQIKRLTSKVEALEASGNVRYVSGAVDGNVLLGECKVQEDGA